MVSTAMQTNVLTEKSCWLMEPVSNAHYTRKQTRALGIVYLRTVLVAVFSRKTEDAGDAHYGPGRCPMAKHVELTALQDRQ